jgi:exopolyphosphatase/guanosine-5'-triphosphate,3'-diphosphate pyrophosphatase
MLVLRPRQPPRSVGVLSVPHHGKKQARPGDAPFLAVLDLGTNNCRLLIAQVSGGGFKVVDSFSRIVRLGEGVAASGALSDAAIARTLAALKVCAERIARFPGARVRAVVTQAGRLARNADTLIRRAAAEAGITLEVISAEEEAGLAAAGCTPLVGKQYRGALVFDIGGGSTEIIMLTRRADGMDRKLIASVPVGVVSLAEEAGGRDFAALSAAMQARFGAFAPQTEALFDPNAHHLLGTSGTVTTLAAIALNLPRYNRARVDGSWHQTEKLMAVVNRLAVSSVADLAQLGSIGPERADLMLPGCAIFAAICGLWPSPMLRVADRGLRDGMLRQLVGTERA